MKNIFLQKFNKDTFLAECGGGLGNTILPSDAILTDCYYFGVSIGMQHLVKQPIIQLAFIPLGMQKFVKQPIIQPTFIRLGMQQFVKQPIIQSSHIPL